MTKKDNEDFENSTKCSICDNDYIDGKSKKSLSYHWKVLLIEIVISMLN